MLVHTLALSCFSNAPQTKQGPFIKWAIMVVWTTFSCFSFRYWHFFFKDSFGEFQAQWGFWTCCLMRRNSIYSTVGRCKDRLSRVEIEIIETCQEPSNWCCSMPPQSLVASKRSEGQWSFFIKWAPWQFRRCHIVFCFRLWHFLLRW